MEDAHDHSLQRMLIAGLVEPRRTLLARLPWAQTPTHRSPRARTAN